MRKSLSVLLTGLVDYAGLFPPAKLDMASAVRAYADYLHDPHRFMLGSFVVPMTRLPELTHALAALPAEERHAMPWRVSALAGPDVEADVTLSNEFNAQHSANAVDVSAIIDSLEIKVSSPAEIAAAMSRMPTQYKAVFEIPLEPDPEPFIAELRRSGGMAKIRTGGVTQEAFPSVSHIARFMMRCHAHGVAFKATAGLHHPIRATYRLTYEEQPPVGMMYGYLNVFLAAAFVYAGVDVALVEAVLTETDPTTFVFRETDVTYRDHVLPLTVLQDARSRFALSFGSCSFREPVDDLVPLGWEDSAHLALP